MNRRRNAIKLLGRQVYYEQLSFWRNAFAAVFTLGFALIFLIFLDATNGKSLIPYYHVTEIQYYVPSFAAYGIMSACFNNLAISLVVRRETGLLKRLRLSPLPTSVMLAGVFLSAFVVAAIEVLILLGVGRVGFGVQLPHNIAAFLVAIAVGAVSFSALGVAASTFVPNQEAAGPMVSFVFFILLFLSGLYFPLNPGSELAKISSWLPIHRLILAMFAPFDLVPGTSTWQWHDIGVIAVWGVVGAFIAFRRFRFEPRRG